MYNMEQVTYGDSKYTVADILSSMANGEPLLTPTFSSSTFCGIQTGTTPTLTPTTLVNLENTFIDLAAAQECSIPRTQSGFVPPVIDPITSNDGSYDDEDLEWMPTGVKRTRTSRTTYTSAPSPYAYSPPAPQRRGGGRRVKDEHMFPPEEIARRRLRRERNKLAAAKCRQRRVDHTNVLIGDTDELEEEQASLENQIQTLQQQKEQLEFILQAHKPLCKNVKCEANANSPPTRRPQSLPLRKTVVVKSEPGSSSDHGVPITTPSNGIFSFSLDSLGGRTGLTPISEALKTGLTPTCSAQQRNSSDSSPDVLNSPTLISL